MICIINVARYPKFLGWAGFLSMAVFRIPLLLNKEISFWKLMGSGRNGTFDIHPDWRQWAILMITPNSKPQTPNFIVGWHRFFNCETWTVQLEPLEGHGAWDGKQCFGTLPRESNYEGRIAVLTRATIRLRKLRNFWKNVPAVANRTAGAEGFIASLGIGEVPFIKQATFSVWESKAAMKTFAYKMQEHTGVIQKTRREDWYSEEMFVRFRIITSDGTLHGKNPLKEKR